MLPHRKGIKLLMGLVEVHDSQYVVLGQVRVDKFRFRFILGEHIPGIWEE